MISYENKPKYNIKDKFQVFLKGDLAAVDYHCIMESLKWIQLWELQQAVRRGWKWFSQEINITKTNSISTVQRQSLNIEACTLWPELFYSLTLRLSAVTPGTWSMTRVISSWHGLSTEYACTNVVSSLGVMLSCCPCICRQCSSELITCCDMSPVIHCLSNTYNRAKLKSDWFGKIPNTLVLQKMYKIFTNTILFHKKWSLWQVYRHIRA